ncbi:MAG: hypothetical protein PHD37_00920 [Gallionellaceae bacterium]|nr:hypothetical protein [Gallionellaceae bacterium]
MAHYRKIDVRIWNDAKFSGLSNSAKLIFLFLVTHPQMTALGAMRATPQGLAAELQMELETFAEAFGEALAQGMAKHDRNSCCIYLPNFLRYQSAESPNVLRNWSKQVEYIPECELKTRAIAGLRGYAEGLSKGFLKAFKEAFPEDFPESVNSKQRAVSSKPKPPSQGERLHLGDTHARGAAEEIGGHDGNAVGAENLDWPAGRVS